MNMALERTYTVPLRSFFLRAPKYNRTPRAVRAIREFLARHMHTDKTNVRIGVHLNNHLWSRGIRNPPHKVKLTAIKDDEGIVKAELVGKTFEEGPTQTPLPGKTESHEDHDHEGHDHAKPADEEKIKKELEKLDKETKTLEKKKVPVEKKSTPPAEKKETPIVEKKDAPVVEKKETPPVEKKETPVVEKKDAPVVEKKDAPPAEKKAGPAGEKQQTL